MAAMLQTRGRGWIQESYETGDPVLKTRAKQLRALGYRVVSSSMGPQVTQYGVVKMTLLDIRPGTSGDEYLEQVNPRWRNNVGWKRTGLGKRSIRAFKKRSKKEGFKHEDIRRTIKSHFYKGVGKVNAPRVKGSKVKGGRAVTLRNFTGTVVQKSDGSVHFLGKGR